MLCWISIRDTYERWNHLALASLLIACAPISLAQSQSPALKVFTAADGSFAFRYSNQLIDCGLSEGATNKSSDDACSSYFPMCDGGVSDHQSSIICLAYPKNKFTDTPSFEAATFSVEEITNIKNQEDCWASPPNLSTILRRSLMITIHGVRFKILEFAEGGMNQGIDSEVYRGFHRGACYQLGINVATADSHTFDPPARELTKKDWRQVRGSLEQARDSFRFLK